MNLEYKKYSEIVYKINNTYSKRYNLYNLLMYCIKAIKQGKKDNLREGLKNIFEDFSINIDDLILILKYQKNKKDNSYNVYTELEFYIKNFKEGRINKNLQFIK